MVGSPQSREGDGMSDDPVLAATEPLNSDPGADEHAGLLGRALNSIGVFFALGILCSAGILFLEVVLRYAFDSPTIWVHETVIFINACAFVFGGLFVAARNAHIRVVLIYDTLSARWRRLFDIAISLACAVASAFFAWAAWQSVKKAAWTPQGEFRLETSGSAWSPPTPGLLKIFLFVILILMTIQFAIFAFNYLRKRA